MIAGRKLADYHHRFGAFLIDWHIRTIPIALWGFWVFFEWFPRFWQAAPRGTQVFSVAWQLLQPILQRPDVLWAGLLGMLIYLLYHPVVELLMHGNSPGKRMMHIEVVTPQGNAPSTRQILVRNLWRAIEFLPFAYLWGCLAIIRSPENARTGDVMAGTRVVMK